MYKNVQGISNLKYLLSIYSTKNCKPPLWSLIGYWLCELWWTSVLCLLSTFVLPGPAFVHSHGYCGVVHSNSWLAQGWKWSNEPLPWDFELCSLKSVVSTVREMFPIVWRNPYCFERTWNGPKKKNRWGEQNS